MGVSPMLAIETTQKNPYISGRFYICAPGTGGTPVLRLSVAFDSIIGGGI
jgi:hypothetical protein